MAEPMTARPDAASRTPVATTMIPAPSTATPAPSTATPAPAAMRAAEKASTPAAATATPAPSTATPAPATSAPGPTTSSDVPSMANPAAAEAPYADTVGRVEARREMPAVAMPIPAPMASTAAPNTPMPTAPAVSAGPIAAAPAARAAMAATSPTSASAAAGPADASWMAAWTMMYRPADASRTAAPTASTAAASASICVALIADTEPSTWVAPESGATAGAAGAALPASWPMAETSPLNPFATETAVDAILYAAKAPPIAAMATTAAWAGAGSAWNPAARASSGVAPFCRAAVTCWSVVFAAPSAGPSAPESRFTREVMDGCSVVRMSARPPSTVACSWPNAPSKVEAEVAASFAASVMPRSMIAWLNSSAVICPSAMASRKLPV